MEKGYIFLETIMLGFLALAMTAGLCLWYRAADLRETGRLMAGAAFLAQERLAVLDYGRGAEQRLGSSQTVERDGRQYQVSESSVKAEIEGVRRCTIQVAWEEGGQHRVLEFHRSIWEDSRSSAGVFPVGDSRYAANHGSPAAFLGHGLPVRHTAGSGGTQ
jgi:hypothetical protein